MVVILCIYMSSLYSPQILLWIQEFFFTWCTWWYCLLFSVCFFIFTSSSSLLLSISGMTIFHVTSFIPVKVLLSLIHYFCYIHHHNNLVNIVVSSKNRTQTLDLRKNGTPKKRTCWKNQTSGTKNFVVCLLSHERQCWNVSCWCTK